MIKLKKFNDYSTNESLENINENKIRGNTDSFAYYVESVFTLTNIFNLLIDEGYLSNDGFLKGETTFQDILDYLQSQDILITKANSIDELRSELYHDIDKLEVFKKDSNANMPIDGVDSKYL
jgi:hypothetical protein